MKILLLSFYFPPDLSAGSFRAKALVDALHRQGGPGLQVDVITTMPNRYATFSNSAEEFEETDWLKVRRMKVPSHNSGMSQQTRTFASYAAQVLSRTKRESWDVVVATSSRLMTAVLGAQVARRSGSPLYLDMRDIFTDTIGDLLQASPAQSLLPALRRIERWAVRRAARVNLVSPGFLPYFCKLDGSKEYRLFTNGIDEEFLEQSCWTATNPASVPVILYAGNIGESQGLHRIVPAAARKLEGRARLRIVGDGGRRAQLRQALAEVDATNVDLLDPVSRPQLHDQYRQADMLFLHLNDHEAFKKVLPSKLFEYAATGKPILAGVSGHAAEFVREHVPGAEVFAPCDADGMELAFERLQQCPAQVDREEFRSSFARTRIMDEWARDILQLGSERGA